MLALRLALAFGLGLGLGLGFGVAQLPSRLDAATDDGDGGQVGRRKVLRREGACHGTWGCRPWHMGLQGVAPGLQAMAHRAAAPAVRPPT